MEMKLVDAFMYPCTIRRIMLGSRDQFEEMNRAIAVNKIKPVVEHKLPMSQLKEAFKLMIV